MYGNEALARIKNMKTIDLKIAENEEKLRKLKERCDHISAELDQLYEEKRHWKIRNYYKP